MRWLVTLLLGTMASAAIWLVGAHEVAYLGYVMVALAREPMTAGSCRRRLSGRSPS
jgi:ABC-type uncharacterized transport system permease subunit